MKKELYNLDQYEDILTKEQMRIVCHISKRKAMYLLQSGLIPCINTGKKTHTYIRHFREYGYPVPRSERKTVIRTFDRPPFLCYDVDTKRNGGQFYAREKSQNEVFGL